MRKDYLLQKDDLANPFVQLAKEIFVAGRKSALALDLEKQTEDALVEIDHPLLKGGEKFRVRVTAFRAAKVDLGPTRRKNAKGGLLAGWARFERTPLPSKFFCHPPNSLRPKSSGAPNGKLGCHQFPR